MAEMNTFGGRLRAARKAKGVTQKELAAQIGAKHNSVSNWENDQNRPDSGMLERICGALDVAADFLLGRRGGGLPAEVIPVSRMKLQRIPLIGEIAAGEPILAEQDYETYAAVDLPIKADYALTVRGDSMEPTYLSGDVIYIREQPDVDDGQIAVVLVDDSATLKHVYHEKDGLLLVSENPRYPPMRKAFEDYDCIRILGVVVGFTRMYAANDKLRGVVKGMR